MKRDFFRIRIRTVKTHSLCLCLCQNLQSYKVLCEQINKFLSTHICLLFTHSSLHTWRNSFPPYEDLKIPEMLFTSHNTPHITLGNEQCLKLLPWEFTTLKRGAISHYLWLRNTTYFPGKQERWLLRHTHSTSLRHTHPWLRQPRKYQCYGSGSEIRCLFDPWIRDPVYG